MHKKIDSLEVILKITERCNINCTYCYYFNGSNDDYLNKPKYITQQTVLDVAKFLRNAAIEHGIPYIQIDLHGGEPLMLSHPKFSAMLQTLQDTITPICEIKFVLQTNGMLVNADWIEVFKRFDVSVGVSMDGLAVDHDAQRVDFQGRGTYDKVVAGLKLLVDAANREQILPIGVLCVIQPGRDGALTYRHMVDELGIKRLHFIEPDTTRDCASPQDAEGVDRYFRGVLQEWLKDGHEKVHVRIFTAAMSKLLTGADKTEVNRCAITIRSDGKLDPEDDLRNARKALFNSEFNVLKHTLKDFLSDDAIRSCSAALDAIPTSCKTCTFQNVCAGGRTFSSASNRYSFANGFNNRSVYCHAYQHVMVEMSRYLLARGVAWQHLDTALVSI